jgi:PDZ domain/C2 domain
MLRSGLLFSLSLTWLVGCVYPRRQTTLTEVAPKTPIDRATQPANLWQLQLLSAEIPDETRAGLSWDDERGAPDVYFVLLAKDQQIWKSAVVENSRSPTQFDPDWAVNLTFDRNARLGLQLWDEDSVGADPIGVYQGRALAAAALDSPILVKLDSGASVTLRVAEPKPMLGTGVFEYEIRPGALYVIEVLPNSPAARGGLERGDRITAIDGKSIKSLGNEGATSALSLAAQKESELTVERNKIQRKVKLDKGFVWTNGALSASSPAPSSP